MRNYKAVLHDTEKARHRRARDAALKALKLMELCSAQADLFRQAAASARAAAQAAHASSGAVVAAGQAAEAAITLGATSAQAAVAGQAAAAAYAAAISGDQPESAAHAAATQAGATAVELTAVELTQCPAPVLEAFTNMWLQPAMLSPLTWHNVGTEKPAGTELSNVRLSAALQSQSVFTKAQWEKLGVADPEHDDFIKSGTHYFKAKPGWFQPLRRVWVCAHAHACVRMRMRVCVRVCVRACVHAHVCTCRIGRRI